MFEQPMLSLSSRAFPALSEPDLYALQCWIPAAREAGIGDVEDLTARSWPANFSGAVIGVFTPGEEHAAWLAVGQNGTWAIASCSDGRVSEPVASLADALAMVWPAGEAPECA